MVIAGTKTEENLKAAFAGESQARNRYTFSGRLAREAGLHDVADVFFELAANEEEHARQEFEFLGGLSDVRAALEQAAAGEHHEHEVVYPCFAQTAREEGLSDVASFFERMTRVEGTHEQRFRALLRSLDGEEAFKGKTVLHSLTKMAQVMLPNQANPHGFVHGGELMKIIDNAAGVTAVRHSRQYVVLARVAELNFHRPVQVSDVALVDSRVSFVSRSTMEIQVLLDAESLETAETHRAVSAYLIMVAVDSKGNPVEVPPLLLSTEEQERLFEEGKARYEAHKRLRAKA
ncbi:MAG: hypothetical protein HZB55_22470 [Deltaproteobacteria bacterium]|nr:hypothetical protein [Deltaproteobacteria bacterium]